MFIIINKIWNFVKKTVTPVDPVEQYLSESYDLEDFERRERRVENGEWGREWAKIDRYLYGFNQ